MNRIRKNDRLFVKRQIHSSTVTNGFWSRIIPFELGVRQMFSKIAIRTISDSKSSLTNRNVISSSTCLHIRTRQNRL